MQLEPEVSRRRVWRWRPTAYAIIVVVIASACSLVITSRRSAEDRREAAEAHTQQLLAQIVAQEVQLLRCLDGDCNPPHVRDLDLEAAKRRLHELQCIQRKAKLEAAFAKNDPVAWVLDDVAGDIRAYRGECAVDDSRVEELARRLDEATRDAGTALDRDMIQRGIASVRRGVLACGERSTAKGKVKLHVTVAPDGQPSSVTLVSTPDNTLGECVLHAVARARFAATDQGGSFSYPFLF